uniref:TIR domain-containing protein n=1 Tax=Candidatus Kentrum sp. FW TaxID=2126338 RepID=A0A450TBF3_9GAMM|nr:MAG: TIR domain-containing protein [Candidatus Kentron sp. FW]
MTYDVFLSHRSENKPWVEILARNLVDCGQRVFFDNWEMVAGKSVAAQLDAALENSRAGVLVATPESLESGWVREEYDRMLKMQVNGNLTLLPLIFGAIPGFPFLDNRLCIDFGDPTPDGYRRAFYGLLCGLQGRPPGDLSRGIPALPAPIHIPEPMVPDLANMAPQPLAGGESDFLEDVFDCLGQRPPLPVLLLAQAGRDRLGIHQAILVRAKTRFGADNCHHVVPPGDPDIPTPDYLATIARQLGLPQGIGDGFALETALEEQLRSHPLFLLITRLHSGSAAGRRLLAGMLRSLGERHDNLHLVLCGSEELAALKFADGKLSLFTNADALYWPEPTAGDLHDREGEPIDPTEAEHLLAITGGHPQLLQKCLRRRGRTDCKKLVRRDPDLAALFARYRHNWPQDVARLREWLGRERIGPYRYWPADGLLRDLYWDNLLVERDDQFAWRCLVIREAFLADLDA